MNHNTFRSGLLCCGAALVVGCSGSGGGGGDRSSPPPAPPVNAAPTVSAITNQSTDEGAVLGPLSFTVSDAETAAEALTVEVTSSDAALLAPADIELGGAGGSRDLTIFLSPAKAGVATVTLAVMDGGGARSTSSFELTVNPLLSAVASQWLRETVLSRDAEGNPVGVPAADGDAVPQNEDVNRIRFDDDTVEDPAAYDDLIPPEPEPA